MLAGSPECTWTLTTPPTLEPFDVEEAKAQIRSVQHQEDALVAAYIKAARQSAEDYLGRGLLTQTWTLHISDFVDVLPLPMAAPLQSITHVKYYDVDGALQTLSASTYTVDTVSRPGRIALAANETWPAVQSLRKVSRIEVAYVVGWTAKGLIPESIRTGMRVLIGYLDADRDGMEVNAEQALRVAKTFWTDRVFWTPPSYAGVIY